MSLSIEPWDNEEVMCLENEQLSLVVAPEVGGRIVSLKMNGYEFLWRNASLPLRLEAIGAPYDPNFFGGIDELLPNDIEEEIGGKNSPDHGELWTLPLAAVLEDKTITLRGRLSLCNLSYERVIRLKGTTVESTYHIANRGEHMLAFLWKLHAALRIEPGDKIICPAERMRPGALEYSSLKSKVPAPWSSYTIPEFNGTTEFLHLDGLHEGKMRWESCDGHRFFEYRFDPEVLPFPWYFASYGGFEGHLVGILEPCTTLGLHVSDAAARGETAILNPGESITTTVVIEVGAQV
ncbi:MAG TPA: hypothetical protein VG944_20630 [Fimbriimonas sp.]|nr:hypothetical protein [Fimbriimonas sp.]